MQQLFLALASTCSSRLVLAHGPALASRGSRSLKAVVGCRQPPWSLDPGALPCIGPQNHLRMRVFTGRPQLAPQPATSHLRSSAMSRWRPRTGSWDASSSSACSSSGVYCLRRAGACVCRLQHSMLDVSCNACKEDWCVGRLSCCTEFQCTDAAPKHSNQSTDTGSCLGQQHQQQRPHLRVTWWWRSRACFICSATSLMSSAKGWLFIH